MRAETFSIRSGHGSKSTVEKAAQGIFTACGFFAVLCLRAVPKNSLKTLSMSPFPHYG